MKYIPIRFKPQRGKFTQTLDVKGAQFGERFKPQRGKFTLVVVVNGYSARVVSNPNGVNLHLPARYAKRLPSLFQTPTG